MQRPPSKSALSLRLPPLTAIRAFEAVARLGSFSLAATELGVTDGAISKQILLLEDRIGARLFERHAGSTELTLEGREVAESVIPAFAALATGFSRLRRSDPQSSAFRLATVASLATALVPSMAAFESRHPDISLELRTSDRLVDLYREDIDLSVRYGAGDWEDLVVAPLTPFELVGVCSGTTWQTCRQDVGHLLATRRRIQIFVGDEWLEWPAVAAFEDERAPLVLEHFTVALEAVRCDLGIALLPEIIVRRDLAAGSLARFGAPVPWRHAFHSAYRPGSNKPGERDAVLAWLRAAVSADA
ncbi:MAG: LysR substrate-binding domain-containing protein [Pseudomonadota bacterium]